MKSNISGLNDPGNFKLSGLYFNLKRLFQSTRSSIPLKEKSDDSTQIPSLQTDKSLLWLSGALQRTYTIYLVDDHLIVLDGISALLRSMKNFIIVGTSSDPESALSEILALKPDLVITDIEMPKMSGIELSKAIRAELKDVKILALSMFQDYHHIRKMLDAGVEGYILKSIGKEELLVALQTILSGKMYLSDEASTTFLHGKPAENHAPVSRVILTPRETEIVRLIADELSNQEIGERLFISLQTVETHRKNIMRKTESKTALGLVNMAKENRWI